MSLNLTPNEIVGYRIRPDWHSFNACVVKRYGPNSKSSGQEYETTLAYCKSLKFCCEWIFSHVLRVQSELNQADLEAATGSVADAKGLYQAFDVAQAQVLRAVEELQARMDAAGLTNKLLVQRLGSAVTGDDVAESGTSE